MGKKLLAMLLAVMLVVGMLPVTVLALDANEQVSCRITVTGANFQDANGNHTISQASQSISIKRADVGEDILNSPITATARFVDQGTYWSLVVDIVCGNFRTTIENFNNAKISKTYKDMSKATGTGSAGLSWNSTDEGSTLQISLSGATDITPSASTPPSFDQLAAILNNKIIVNCTNHQVEHEQKAYSLIEGSYSFGSILSLSGSTTVAVFVNSQAYVNNYNQVMGAVHTTSNEQKSITLKWNGNAWTLYESGKTVVFNVACETPAPVKPTAPSDEELKNLLTGKVTVDCINNNASHADKGYGLLDGAYTTTASEDGKTITVTLDNQKYCDAYNADISTGHTLVAEQANKTLTLTHNGTEWVAGNGVTIEVECTTPSQPTAPVKPENLAELLTDVTVKVDCTNTQIDSVHTDGTYEVLEGSYTGAETVSGNAENGYTYTVTVAPALYVAEYNKTTPGHTLNPAEQSKTVTLSYSNGQWAVDEEGKEITFTVTCETPAVTYTVTYTDGVPDAEIFADQVTSGLTAGAATPAFDGGVPSRAGYVFTGWDPAVAAAVIADATYTARWKAIPAAPAGADLKAKVGVRLDCINTSKTHEDKYYELLDGTYTIGQVTYQEGAFHSSITIKATEYIKKYNEYKSGHELAPSNVDTHVIPLIYVEDTGWKVDIQSSGMVFASFEIVCKNAAATTSTSSSSGDYDDVPKTGDESMLILRGFGATIAMMVAFAVILAKKNRAC